MKVASSVPGSVRHRAFRQAARAMTAGRPHTAWEILAAAGLADEWPAFLRIALHRARREFKARIASA